MTINETALTKAADAVGVHLMTRPHHNPATVAQAIAKAVVPPGFVAVRWDDLATVLDLSGGDNPYPEFEHVRDRLRAALGVKG